MVSRTPSRPLAATRVAAPWLAVALAAVLALGCGQNNDPLVPRTFERPGDIAFVCAFTAEGTDQLQVAPTLGSCDGVTGDRDEAFALVGLVTQTASGEVGAVDFRARRVIDADGRVPGFTFTRVGEFPSAIAVSALSPTTTYVASFGSRRVESYPTAAFLSDEPSNVMAGTVPLRGAPTDMVLGPEKGAAANALYVALPGRGAVGQVVIEAGDRSLGAATEVVVTVPGTLPLPTAGVATTYERFCPSSLAISDPDPAGVRTEILQAGTTAQPHALLVAPNGTCTDPLAVCPAELLAADRELPLIHRFAIGADGSLSELEPLATGVPTRELALSPPVPVAAPGTAGSDQWTQYLYAIDDTDQSVMVLEYGDPTSPTFGSILPVRGGARVSDRLRLTGPAHSLDVLTPGYDARVLADPSSPSTYCSTPIQQEGPTRLRGVFLAVGLATGTVQMVDVADLDLSCRGVSCVPGGDTTVLPQDQFVYLQRHRPRVGSFIPEGLSLLGSPSVLVDGANRPVIDREPGYVDGLLPFYAPGVLDSYPPPDPASTPPSCLPGHQPIFETSVCAASDPWSLPAEVWRAEWEGTIPGTTALVRYDPEAGALRLIDSTEVFCERGVLGAANVALSLLTDGLDPEFGYTGDTVVITTAPDESRRGGACEPFFEQTDGSETAELAFRIIDARPGEMVLDTRDPRIDALLTPCFGTVMGVQIRTTGAFTVQGSRSGFLHRVVDRGGSCRVDTGEQPIVPGVAATYLNGRAFRGTDREVPGSAIVTRPYVNPYIAFHLGVVPVVDEARIEIVLEGLPDLFAVRLGARGNGSPVSTVIESVVYSDVDQRMYVIDSSTSSLVQYELSSFQVLRIYE